MYSIQPYLIKFISDLREVGIYSQLTLDQFAAKKTDHRKIADMLLLLKLHTYKHT